MQLSGLIGAVVCTGAATGSAGLSTRCGRTSRAGDGLWVVTSDDPRASAIERVDARTGKVTAMVELGTHYPRSLVPVPGGLWVVSGDGTVLLVDTK